jgi:hypothetical protein
VKSLRSAPSGGQAFLAGALALAATFGLVGWRLLRPPAPVLADAPATEFSAVRAEEVLVRLLGDGQPRPTGGAANAAARARVLAELERLGVETTVQEGFACSRSSCATVNNVLARVAGAGIGKAVLIATHYDSVGAGPGVSDDLASVAATLEVLRALAAAPRLPRPVVVLIDDGEEIGLLGARAFAADHPWADGVGAVVNLEARGTGGPSYLFETSADNGWLIEAFAREARRPATSSIFYSIYRRLPNDTDFTVFKAHGMSGINFAYIGAVSRYHTPLDDLAHLDRRSLQQQGENALAAVRGLATALAAERSGDDGAVYFDLLTWRVVRWPLAWTMPLALGAVLSLLLATRAAGRTERGKSGLRPLSGGIDLLDRLSPGSALLGAIGALVSLAAAWAATRAVLWMLDRIGATPVEHPATRPWLTALAWTTGALAALLAGRWFARRAGPRGAWTGWWFLLALAGVALAVVEPSAAYAAILPAFAAGLSALVEGLRWGGRGVASPLATVVPVATGALVLGPFAWAIDHALGVPVLPVVAVLTALLTLPLLPALAMVERWWRSPARWPPLLLALAALGLVAPAVGLPPLRADLPERLSLRLHRDATAGTSHWVTVPESGAVPPALREAAGFRAEPERPWPWSSASDGFRAVAGELGAELPPPEFEPLPAAGAPPGTVRARLRSARGAPLVALMLPPDVAGRVESARLGGRAFEPVGKRETAAGDWRALLSWTTPPAGIELELVLAPGPPFEAVLYDQSPGLPEAASALLRTRPDTAVPSGAGDAVLVSRRVRIGA